MLAPGVEETEPESDEEDEPSSHEPESLEDEPSSQPPVSSPDELEESVDVDELSVLVLVLAGFATPASAGSSPS